MRNIQVLTAFLSALSLSGCASRPIVSAVDPQTDSQRCMSLFKNMHNAAAVRQHALATRKLNENLNRVSDPAERRQISKNMEAWSRADQKGMDEDFALKDLDLTAQDLFQQLLNGKTTFEDIRATIVQKKLNIILSATNPAEGTSVCMIDPQHGMQLFGTLDWVAQTGRITKYDFDTIKTLGAQLAPLNTPISPAL